MWESQTKDTNESAFRTQWIAQLNQLSLSTAPQLPSLWQGGFGNEGLS
jgi:hypothetical protein